MALRLMDIKNQLDRHEAEDREFHLEVIDTRKDIRDIKENHLAHVQASMTKIETNLDWMMKFFWIIVPAIVGALIMGGMNLILK